MFLSPLACVAAATMVVCVTERRSLSGDPLNFSTVQRDLRGGQMWIISECSVAALMATWGCPLDTAARSCRCRRRRPPAMTSRTASPGGGVTRGSCSSFSSCSMGGSKGSSTSSSSSNAGLDQTQRLE
ncbi:hypothetical protein HU200_006403 [Digitaria exilis]|uniref:Uncharacterized protein n=1 Tax=Digitaria exilis TaxID=1010633 RepID=A0A835FS74_9POAL|nr:hypothetical protein HU200_006403 [Digitaria exilis]